MELIKVVESLNGERFRCKEDYLPGRFTFDVKKDSIWEVVETLEDSVRLDNIMYYGNFQISKKDLDKYFKEVFEESPLRKILKKDIEFLDIEIENAKNLLSRLIEEKEERVYLLENSKN